MNITLEFTELELNQVISDSPVFRDMIVKRFVAQQEMLAKVAAPFTNEATMVENLRNRIRSVVRHDNKIQCIKDVRQWTVDNKAFISPQKYEELYSLSGAKAFVENLMRW